MTRDEAVAYARRRLQRAIHDLADATDARLVRARDEVFSAADALDEYLITEELCIEPVNEEE